MSALLAMPVPAGGAHPGQGRIAFYGDILDLIDGHSPLVVRPSTLYLAEDGSVVLGHLKWSGWGSSVARATGVMSTSDCNPSCADGKRTNRPAQLTLSDPGTVYGHRIYRCYQVSPHRVHAGLFGHGCIRREGKFYMYDTGSGDGNSNPGKP